MILVMFDMDGTLIDTQALITEHMATTFESVGLEAPTPAESRRVIGLSLPVAMARLAKSDDSVLIETLVDTYKTHYRASLVADAGREGLFPGALEALQQLRQRDDVVMGIATGKGLHGVHRITGLHGIADYFVTLQTPDHNPSKPHPGMLETAIRETGAKADRTIMVGDTTFDIEMGVAAKCKTVGVTWGYHEPRELIAVGASTMIDRFDQLDGAIRQLVE
ncbi:HAD-IA family hydrolase [Devosia lacusdianchii]|uniref:HAD-IA family hydrolase n=1 Tax=Devosia lacusdianchii TaxID=2917991 RepID=UPI001F0696FF|nr:HAD-IA family hydrolase [Devosia sp. JXJ CY 41]